MAFWPGSRRRLAPGHEESPEQTPESPHLLGFAPGQLDKVLRITSWSRPTSKSLSSLFVFTKYSVLMHVNLTCVAFAWQAVKHNPKIIRANLPPKQMRAQVHFVMWLPSVLTVIAHTVDGKALSFM